VVIVKVVAFSRRRSQIHKSWHWVIAKYTERCNCVKVISSLPLIIVIPSVTSSKALSVSSTLKSPSPSPTRPALVLAISFCWRGGFRCRSS
jgi:hypothetical protein